MTAGVSAEARVRPAARNLAAIDVGTNAVRLTIARTGPRGALDIVSDERDAIRPGEGAFESGLISDAATERLIFVLRRYAGACAQAGAQVRAVATSALRDARNGDQIVRRIWREVGLELEVISGREEARLVCLAALGGQPDSKRSLVLDIGGGSTEIVLAIGESPLALWSLRLGAVRLGERALAEGATCDADVVRLVRGWTDGALETAFRRLVPRTDVAVGTSGGIRAIVDFATGGGKSIDRPGIAAAIEALLAMGPEGRARRFEPRRADVILPGALILERLLGFLDVNHLIATRAGLRQGILRELSACC
jgi:exopolyphosphatase/guanosine-5'-triphosphate,3'-diphosphate pyrophosphatase